MLQAGPGAHVAVKGLKVDNQGWEWAALPEDSASEAEELRIRGFKVGWWCVWGGGAVLKGGAVCWCGPDTWLGPCSCCTQLSAKGEITMPGSMLPMLGYHTAADFHHVHLAMHRSWLHLAHYYIVHLPGLMSSAVCATCCNCCYMRACMTGLADTASCCPPQVLRKATSKFMYGQEGHFTLPEPVSTGHEVYGVDPFYGGQAKGDGGSGAGGSGGNDSAAAIGVAEAIAAVNSMGM